MKRENKSKVKEGKVRERTINRKENGRQGRVSLWICTKRRI
jgi:hypothetical protein